MGWDRQGRVWRGRDWRGMGANGPTDLSLSPDSKCGGGISIPREFCTQRKPPEAKERVCVNMEAWKLQQYKDRIKGAKASGRGFVSIGVEEFAAILKEVSTLHAHIQQIQKYLPETLVAEINATNCLNQEKRKRNRERIRAIKEKGKCLECGETNPSLLTFHHRNPEEKSFDIAQGTGRDWPVLQAEIAKCDLLCDACHKIRHGLMTLITC